MEKNSPKDAHQVTHFGICTPRQVMYQLIKLINHLLGIVTLVKKKSIKYRMCIGHVSIAILTYARKFYLLSSNCGGYKNTTCPFDHPL